MIYAVGEIALVVIGILIALQINNWNQYRLERQEESKILQEIRIALISDLTNQFDFHIANSERIMKKLDIIYDHVTQNIPYHDSLALHLRIISHGGWKDWTPQLTPFESLKSKGVDLISKPKLKSAILNLYNLTYPSIAYRYDNYKNNIESYGRPLARSHFNFGDSMFGGEDEELTLVPLDYSGLSSNTEFMNVIKVLKQLNLRDKKNLITEKIQAEAVIEMIEAELRIE